MFNPNIKETFSLLLAITYSYDKTERYDYKKEPRPCHNFVFITQGQGYITFNEQTLLVEKGDILFIPKNTTYNAIWQAQPNVIFHSIHFDFQAKNDPLFGINLKIQKLDNKDFYRMLPLIDGIKAYQFSNNEDAFFTLSYFYDICGTLLKSVVFESSKPINKTILPAIYYLEKNYFKPISIKELASQCFLSPSRFHYLFKQQTGTSPIIYKNKIAIQNAAKELIYNDSSSIKDISEKYGFTSFIYFERLFKSIMQKTPSQYRKSNKLL